MNERLYNYLEKIAARAEVRNFIKSVRNAASELKSPEADLRAIASKLGLDANQETITRLENIQKSHQQGQKVGKAQLDDLVESALTDKRQVLERRGEDATSFLGKENAKDVRDTFTQVNSGIRHINPNYKGPQDKIRKRNDWAFLKGLEDANIITKQDRIDYIKSGGKIRSSALDAAIKKRRNDRNNPVTSQEAYVARAKLKAAKIRQIESKLTNKQELNASEKRLYAKLKIQNAADYAEEQARVANAYNKAGIHNLDATYRSKLNETRPMKDRESVIDKYKQLHDTPSYLNEMEGGFTLRGGAHIEDDNNMIHDYYDRIERAKGHLGRIKEHFNLADSGISNVRKLKSLRDYKQVDSKFSHEMGDVISGKDVDAYGDILINRANSIIAGASPNASNEAKARFGNFLREAGGDVEKAKNLVYSKYNINTMKNKTDKERMALSLDRGGTMISPMQATRKNLAKDPSKLHKLEHELKVSEDKLKDAISQHKSNIELDEINKRKVIEEQRIKAERDQRDFELRELERKKLEQQQQQQKEQEKFKSDESGGPGGGDLNFDKNTKGPKGPSGGGPGSTGGGPGSTGGGPGSTGGGPGSTGGGPGSTGGGSPGGSVGGSPKGSPSSIPTSSPSGSPSNSDKDKYMWPSLAGGALAAGGIGAMYHLNNKNNKNDRKSY